MGESFSPPGSAGPGSSLVDTFGFTAGDARQRPLNVINIQEDQVINLLEQIKTVLQIGFDVADTDVDITNEPN